MAITTTAEIASRLSATSALLTIGNADAFSVADAGADQIINYGESGYLQGLGGVSYAWTPSNDLDCPECQNTNASPTLTTIYTLMVTDSFGCVGIEGSNALYKGDYFIHDNSAGAYGIKNLESRVENNSYFIALNENDSEMTRDDFGLFDIVSGATVTGEWDPQVFPSPEFKGEDGYLDKDIYYNGMKLLSGVHSPLKRSQ